MLPTKKLILGLRETAQELREHPEKYDWDIGHKCNCGLLARNLGWNKAVGVGTWSGKAVTERCMATGRRITELFNFLRGCGLEKGDFNSIEYINHKGSYNNPLHVAQWMDQKADELERRRVTEKGGDVK